MKALFMAFLVLFATSAMAVEPECPETTKEVTSQTSVPHVERDYHR